MKQKLTDWWLAFKRAVLASDEADQGRVLRRNFISFAWVIAVTFSVIGYITLVGDKKVGQSEIWINHTQEIIDRSERINTLVEAMVAEQRGYILSGDKKFIITYEERKAALEGILAQLNELIQDNESQAARLLQITKHISDLTTKLETRARNFRAPMVSRDFIVGVTSITQSKSDIVRVNSDLMGEERNLLNSRIHLVEKKKDNYSISFLIAMGFSAVLLVLMNAFLLRAQSLRSRAERNLKSTEERFALAIDGANDGVFDFNLVTGDVYFSKRIFSMLGDNRGSSTCKKEEFLKLMHPEDIQDTLAHLDAYLRGEIPEYSQNFRARHASGNWIWVRSRAKAIHDAQGQPVRMVGSHTDITELMDQQTRLEKEIERADAANRAKTDFLAHMSHEIRTPLTAISGIAEILGRQKDRLDEKQQRLVKTLATSTLTLKDLINDILDFSKIESGELELVDAPFLLDDLFQQLISIISVGAQEKGLDFICDFGDLKGMSFQGDQMRVRQVLLNLVGNAIKFTDKGSVKVRATIDMIGQDEFMRVDVMDTGIGIADENIERIFERFKQVDASVSRRYGGSGLGLPISTRIVAMMGGEIKVNSTLGKGSVFTILVPMQFAQTAAPQSANANEQARVKAETANYSGGKALIVEDYEGNIVVVSYILDDMGCAYDVARNGVEALEKWNAAQYDVILMDVQMPKMDGFEATKRIRQTESAKGLPRTPIIGMTAHALVGDKDKCIEAGMDAYFPKPIVENDLRKKINEYLGKKEAA